MFLKLFETKENPNVTTILILQNIWELKWKAKVLLIRSADVRCMDARGPTLESTEEIILCIGVVLIVSLSTAGQVRNNSRKILL